MKKRKIQQVFGEPIDDSEFAPIYEKEILVPHELDIAHADFNKMSPEQQYEWMEKVRLHLLGLYHNKRHGLFGQNKDKDEIIRDIKDLINYEIYRDLLIEKGRTYLSHGNFNTSNQWFPEMSETIINDRSLIDMLRIPKYFHTNVRDIMGKDRHKKGENSMGKILVSNFLIDSLRIVNRFQPAFNFPATLARLLYTIYLDEYFDSESDELWVFDPCVGWSGRMTGLLAAFCTPLLEDKKVKYYGTDVNQATEGRFEMVMRFWGYYINSRINQDFELYRSFVPAEFLFRDRRFLELQNKFDVALTSPPYFNREHYSNDKNQSYILYPTYEKWRDGFLRGLIINTYKMLKPCGIFFLNIADVNSNKGDGTFYPLEKDTAIIAKSIGFKVVDVFYMISHIFPGNYSTKNLVLLDGSLKKFEPIFVLQKS